MSLQRCEVRGERVELVAGKHADVGHVHAGVHLVGALEPPDEAIMTIRHDARAEREATADVREIRADDTSRFRAADRMACRTAVKEKELMTLDRQCLRWRHGGLTLLIEPAREFGFFH